MADGVSGWNDFGFSSQAFSNSLMEFCKKEIDEFDSKFSERIQEKNEFKKMRKRGSFMTFDDCLDEE